MAWRGVAWRGVAWRGVAWRGVAKPDEVWGNAVSGVDFFLGLSMASLEEDVKWRVLAAYFDYGLSALYGFHYELVF